MIAPIDPPYSLEARSAVDTFNDSGLGGRDDYLTAAFRARVLTDRVFAIADYNVLTWKERKRRTDQAAAAVGGISRVDAFTFRAGIGAIYDGQLGGEQLQNAWHQNFSHGEEVHLRYRAGTSWTPVLVASATFAAPPLAELLERQVVVDVAAARHSVRVTPGVRVGDASASFGIGYSYYAGSELSSVARKAVKTMKGTTVTVGLNVYGVAFGIEASGKTTLASVGVSW